MKRISMLIGALLMATPCLAQTRADPVRVYVYTTKSLEGFSDSTPRMEDSAVDIRSIFADKNHQHVRLVNSRELADVMVEVKFSGQAAAGTRTDTKIDKGTFGGITSSTSTTAKTLPAIWAILHVRNSDYEKEVSAMQQAFWKELAKSVVWQVDEWVKTNWAQIKAKRTPTD